MMQKSARSGVGFLFFLALGCSCLGCHSDGSPPGEILVYVTMDPLTGRLLQEFQYFIPPPVKVFVHTETGDKIDEARYQQLQRDPESEGELPYELLETRQSTGMVEHGWYRSFFPTGQIKVEGHYWQGEFDGTWTSYDSTGSKNTVRVYERGRRVRYEDYTTD